ncbi:uncharacterized protein TM35_000861010 [Trypanosoma theileri]|uniref:Uncharacterized protein n=1 Tax=Trypanosoma theileri TaxID=67003 RepID=A0A1X0NEP4_9TRYP|nr:uncharacterized protein TM35_000861010 [Trypanosoma theileri]ORC82648.1 hypothetical protein TM35_000861010 [Trypanosoma theileri]
MSTDSELQAKYDVAVERYQAAKQDEAAAKKERDEKWDLVWKSQLTTKEYFLAWAEINKTEMTFIERVKQRYATECERNSCYTDWMKYRHGGDSKETQIAQHRAELAHTMEVVYSDYSPYWIKWYKLDCKVRWVYYQLKAEGYDNIADELDRSRKLFCDRIKANGEALSNARNAAVEALNKWEQEDDRVAWDKAKPEYDAELAKWNQFKPKGVQYAEKLEEKICECAKNSSTGYTIGSKCKSSALKNEIGQNSQTIDDLNAQLDEKDQQIAALKDELDQKSRENDILHGRISALEVTVGDMSTFTRSIIHKNQALINWQCRQLEEFESFARTTIEQEWQNWLERMTSLYENLVNWIQERIVKMAALEKEEAAARNKYKHEFNDSVKEIEKHHFALKEMLSGRIFE